MFALARSHVRVIGCLSEYILGLPPCTPSSTVTASSSNTSSICALICADLSRIVREPPDQPREAQRAPSLGRHIRQLRTTFQLGYTVITPLRTRTAFEFPYAWSDTYHKPAPGQLAVRLRYVRSGGTASARDDVAAPDGHLRPFQLFCRTRHLHTG